jgi:Protein of unknown function (DUF3987)
MQNNVQQKAPPRQQGQGFGADLAGSFNMLDHRDKLKPDGGTQGKTEGSYHCPVCDSPNFKVNHTTGVYGTFGCDCASTEGGKRAIRHAVSPAQKPGGGATAARRISQPAKAAAKAVDPLEGQRWVKPDRAAEPQAFTYPTPEGQPLVQVRREGRKFSQWHWDGAKWVSGLTEEVKASIHLYNAFHPLVMAAKTSGGQVLVVEGERKADQLIALGIAAVCSIGGAGKFDKYGAANYQADLAGAAVAVCPDRDTPGIKHADQVAAAFPECQWLYAEPDSPEWDHPLASGGFDVADWIDGGATAEDILAAVGAKRTAAKSIGGVPEALSVPTAPALTLLDDVVQLIAQELGGSELSAALIDLASVHGVQPKVVQNLYDQRVSEAETPDAAGILEVLDFKKMRLDSSRLFHPSLADVLKATAAAMPTSEAWLITTLLPALGSAMGKKLTLKVKHSAGYLLSPIVWSAIVAKTGEKKSPAQGQIVTPLNRMEIDSHKNWKAENDVYKAQVKAKNPAAVEPPPRRRYTTSTATPEGLTAVLAKSNPDGLLIYRDELAAFFKFNQYKKGGDEEQFYLSIFNGGFNSVDRVDIEKSSLVESSCVGITGSIQYSVLQKIQSEKGFSDGAGMFARFLFCCDSPPPGYLDLESEDPPNRLPEVLRHLYIGLCELPEQTYLLSTGAKKQLQTYQRDLTDRVRDEQHEGIAASMAKFETYASRIALILHCTNAVLQSQSPAEQVTEYTMMRAIEMVQYYEGQARIIYALNDPESGLDREGLKLAELCKKYAEPITAKRAQQFGGIVFRKTPLAQIRQKFKALAAAGLGELTGDGAAMTWFYSV